MKKSYKEYSKRYIGISDYASLILVGCGEEGLNLKELCFGEDNDYLAYVVDSEAEIGAHYKKIASFTHWLKIYDDDSLTAEFKANKIIVYRAGEMGCIIQLIKEGEYDE